MAKQQRWYRRQLEEWLIEIRDHWRGCESEYGPTPMQIRTYKTGRRWEPQPLYKDFVNEFGSYEEALAAVGMKVPPEARKKVGPTLKTRAEQDQEAEEVKEAARIRAEEAKMRLDAKEEKIKQARERRRARATVYDTLGLAKTLQEACDYVGKPSMTVAEYNNWRKLVLEDDPERKMPTPAVFIRRLGDGKWTRVFDAMREMLAESEAVELEPVEPELEPVIVDESEPAEPEPEPESTPEQKLQEFLQTHTAGRPYTQEWLMQYLRLVTEMLGRMPRTLDLERIKGGPERHVYQRWFGGWAEALYAVGLIDEEELKKRQESADKAAEARRRPKVAKTKTKTEAAAVKTVETAETVVEAETESREAEAAPVAARETALDVRVDGEIRHISVAVSRMELQLRLTWQ